MPVLGTRLRIPGGPSKAITANKSIRANASSLNPQQHRSATTTFASISSDSLVSSPFSGLNQLYVQRTRARAFNSAPARTSVMASAVASPSTAPAGMKIVDVQLGDRSYPIYIGTRLLEQKGELLRKHIPGKKVLVITNETIAPLYLDK